MRVLVFIVSFIFALSLITSGAYARNGSRGSYKSGGSVYVKGYTKKDGTYVQPHFRTSPNSTKFDNWSTKGNVNPYTGKEGTKDPFSINDLKPAD